MPRSRPQRPEHVPLRSAVVTSVESGSDGEWNVRRISGASATKTYRCPGCSAARALRPVGCRCREGMRLAPL